MPCREQNSNKGTFGKVLNVAGSENYFGAAYLSSLAAYKIGAGYVALCSHDKVLNSVVQKLPEVVCLSLEEGLRTVGIYNVLLIGCGLGRDEGSKKVLLNFLAAMAEQPIVIDADGLNILSELDYVQLPKNTIITPHPAEAARLLGVNVENILSNMENSAKQLTQKYNCITVLKSHRTIICDRDLQVHVNEHGNSALAKAGTGDILAGTIAGLVAQGLEPFEAAKTGVYIHSVAGEFASGDLTEYSVMASDLVKYFPNAIKTII